MLWAPLKTSFARNCCQRMTSLSCWDDGGPQTSFAVCGSLNLPLGNPIDLQFVLSSIKSMRTDMKSRALRWLQWSYLQHFVILIIRHSLHLSFLFFSCKWLLFVTGPDQRGKKRELNAAGNWFNSRTMQGNAALFSKTACV